MVNGLSYPVASNNFHVGNKRRFDAAANHGLDVNDIGSKASDEAAALEVSQQLYSVMSSAKPFRAIANRAKRGGRDRVVSETELEGAAQ